MNVAEAAIRKKTITLVIAALLVVGGVQSYFNLGRLENPEFTIKEALVVTNYPGATAAEVEQEVTEEIETGIQELAQLKEIESISRAGQSIITVTIKDKYDKHTLPQVWDELRRKVNDVQSLLPPGSGKSIVFDDFGDVYGVLISISGDGFNYAELKDYADFFKREILLLPDVAKVVIWGEQQEEIFVEISRSKMAQLGIGLDAIYATLAKQNLVVDSGAVKVGTEYIRIRPTGEINSVDQISNLLIRGKQTDKLVYLKDIANVSRGYITPPTKHMRFNNKDALALSVSTVQGGNVVTMGDGIKKRLKVLEAQIPLGLNYDFIYLQADDVVKSINSFIVSLIQAIAIVVGILMIFMGLRSGVLIGVILLLTVCGTFVFMDIYHINLERISLGALIIALGMLVDNAIVVTEGILIKINQGVERIKAASEVVEQTIWPLFGATVVAILAFAAIGLSQDATGEYTRSLYYVMLISLMLSWIIAITITPLFCVMFLKEEKKEGVEKVDPYAGIVFKIYKGILSRCIQIRWLTVGGVVALLACAVVAFGLLEDSFFPDSTNPRFMVHYWLPEGTDIRKTSDDLKDIEKFIKADESVESVATFVGEGAPRFTLVYSPEKTYDSYGIMLVTTNDFTKIDKLIAKINNYIGKNYIDANPKIEKIRLGPGGGFDLEPRFSGPDPEVLRNLAKKALAIIRADGGATSIRQNWRERAKVIRPQFAEAQARRAGISRSDLAEALHTTFTGTHVGIYREGDELLPIISRPPEKERLDVDNINDVQVWSRASQKAIPIRQVVTDFVTSWEDPLVHRRNKKRTVTVQADPLVGNASVVLERIMPKIKLIKLPVGYELEWGGEYENSNDAKVGLKANLPVTFLLMVLVVIILFNSLRQPLIIWLTVPLALIGVAFGLLLTGQAFGFMALLGFLSLAGMLVKNAIVLIDEIDLQISTGKEKFIAIIDSSVSRMRPVLMAAITTVMGMMPLLPDVFFQGMAITIMAGLTFATALTLIIVPVFYSIFFNIPYTEIGE